jgi:hypothetical protein
VILCNRSLVAWDSAQGLRHSFFKRQKKAVGEQLWGLLRACETRSRKTAHEDTAKEWVVVSLGIFLSRRSPFLPLRCVGGRLNTSVGPSMAIHPT